APKPETPTSDILATEEPRRNPPPEEQEYLLHQCSVQRNCTSQEREPEAPPALGTATTPSQQLPMATQTPQQPHTRGTAPGESTQHGPLTPHHIFHGGRGRALPHLDSSQTSTLPGPSSIDTATPAVEPPHHASSKDLPGKKHPVTVAEMSWEENRRPAPQWPSGAELGSPSREEALSGGPACRTRQLPGHPHPTYRRQMKEMKRGFNITIIKLHNTSRIAEEQAWKGYKDMPDAQTDNGDNSTVNEDRYHDNHSSHSRTVQFVVGCEAVKQLFLTKMEPLPASFYGKINKRNPVISAFDGDIKKFMSFIKRISTLPTYDHNSYARGLGQWQGYSRYLQQFSTVTIEDIRDVDHFRTSFFPKGFDTDQAKLTFRALQGYCLCAFQLERERGSQPTQEGVQRLLSILGFVRIMMQAVLPHEHLCWLLYNGSLYIYNICRYLMSMSRAAQAMEFLLWACICLETSIPLTTARFLAWRATLYCAVCQCYYDSQAHVQAEVFARRALGKVSELGKLEEMSGLPSTTETQRAYKVATIKRVLMELFEGNAAQFLAIVEALWDTSRRPLQTGMPEEPEIQEMPWPRTPTERVLMELFEGNAAQFLAIVEALWDTSRRPLQTGMPEEPEIQERARDDTLPTCLNAVTANVTLMDMAAAGENFGVLSFHIS
ncbi:unnamed protein product, partial [Coregonus sp. 'balchen']